jgi:hypothetical protein
MGKRQIPETFGSKLLQQDKALFSVPYNEVRMQLVHQLIRAESRKRLAKRVVVGALLVAVAILPIVASRVFGGADPYDKDATVLSITLGGIYFVACSVFLIGMASYYSRFMPRARHAREELRDESISELRREVAELRQVVEDKLTSRQSDQPGPE